jgi:hypothetical protein
MRAYFRQQLQYGKNTLKLYFKHSILARGDEITDFYMNVQPALMLAAIVFFVLGLLEVLRFLWYGSALILTFAFVSYVYSAVKLSIKFRDRTAMLLIMLYFVRAFAWLAGAAITAVKFLLGDKR